MAASRSRRDALAPSLGGAAGVILEDLEAERSYRHRHAPARPEGVRFKDLGLVVIDEEQRFGVGHKEFLKQVRIETEY